MFVFMHRQMLARYNSERMALGLLLVESFDRYIFYSYSKNISEEKANVVKAVIGSFISNTV